MIKKILLKYLLIYIFFIIFYFFYKFSCNSNGDYLRLVFAFVESGLGSSSAAFVSASRITEPWSSTNLITSFLPLQNFLIVANVIFLFFRFISNSYFFRYLLSSSCLCRASSIDISRFLMLSKKLQDPLIH